MCKVFRPNFYWDGGDVSEECPPPSGEVFVEGWRVSLDQNNEMVYAHHLGGPSIEVEFAELPEEVQRKVAAFAKFRFNRLSMAVQAPDLSLLLDI